MYANLLYHVKRRGFVIYFFAVCLEEHLLQTGQQCWDHNPMTLKSTVRNGYVATVCGIQILEQISEGWTKVI